MILFGQDQKLSTVKIVKGAVVISVLVLLVGVAFLGVQWFSNSLESFFNWKLSDIPGLFTASALDVQNVFAEPVPTIPENALPLRNWEEKEVKVSAQAAISVEVVDGHVKYLFNKSEDKKLPVASLTKLMTALVVLQHYNLNQKVQISPAAMAQIGEQGSLKIGETLTVKNLLYILLMESSNRAAYALSEVVGNAKFVAMMNEKAKNLGLVNTHFEDSSGLNAFSYSTAQDVAILSGYLFEKYPLFTGIVGLKEFDLYLENGQLHHRLVNTNILLGEENIIGGKTGWTNEAKGCVMVLQRNMKNNGYIVHIVLGAEDRFGEMKKLTDWVKSAYSW